ncbi:hypothetical protein BKA56DRAFT_718617 [Ilyonectria sp. MPI-CAGE-AT-0026]|nr:hypothetical protein BKA56DRAFT_718617 [Ilyonectria sp. MPI-CAGE-AT-0026]
MASAPDIPPTAFVETMNPERAWMLAEVAREEAAMPPVVVKKENLPPPASGANCAPVGDASSRAARDREKTHQMNLVGNGAVERSHAEFCEERSHKPALPLLPPMPKLSDIPSLGPAPKPNEHTKYLLSLLKHRELHLSLYTRQQDGKGCGKLYKIQISDACLVQHETLSSHPCTRVLPLTSGDPDTSIVEGVIHRSVEGELLEDVWAGLSSQMKRHYARQLRKIVDGMRGVVYSDGRGSVQAGEYTLFLDKHTNHTYYAVRRYTSPKQFMAFLLSSFYKTVPKKVALAFIAPLKVKGRQLLSHCSLCPKNIIVNEGKIAWILGWDCAGYYPGWWDYVKFFEARTRPENLDWYDYAGEIFSAEYPLQLVAYQGLTRCQQL